MSLRLVIVLRRNLRAITDRLPKGVSRWISLLKFSTKSLTNAMQSYQIVVSNSALADLDGIASFVAGMYRPESGHRYANRILGQLASLSFTASICRSSRFVVAKEIHPKAKTLSIVHHRWTVIFHTEDIFAIIDRILPSKMMIK